MNKKVLSFTLLVLTFILALNLNVFAQNKVLIKSVAIEDISYPYSTGSTLDTKATVTADSKSTVVSVSWSETAAGLNRVKVTLKPYINYYYDENTTATVNGDATTTVIVNEDNNLEVYYTFQKDETVSLPNSSATLTHVITVYYSAHGKITPNPIRAPHRKNTTVQIIPDEGYEVKDVIVDGYSVGAVTEYTFRRVTEPHKIKAYFKPIEGYIFESSGDSNEEQEKREMTFTDVNENDWFYDAVENVFQREIFSGVSETRFAPNDNMTRAMIAKALYNLAPDYGYDTSIKADNVFEDINEEDWYADAINWAAEEGIVNGVGNNKFNPSSNVTREQVCVILYNYAKLNENFIDKRTVAAKEKKIALNSYDDASSASKYAEDAVDWAITCNIITGKTSKAIEPQGYATRAEIATMITRFINNI